MKIILVTLFLTITFINTQVIAPFCSKNDHCSNLRQMRSESYCSAGQCLKFGQVPYKTRKTKSTDICASSLNFSILGYCGKLAGVGCTIPIAASLTYQRCMGTLNVEKCEAKTTATVIYSKLNARCDSKTDICPSNQRCINQVCRPRLTVGQLCTSSSDCALGSGCNRGICTLYYSLNRGTPTSSGSYCKGNSDKSGRCGIGGEGGVCYSNADCGSGACKKPAVDSTTDVTGVCFNPSLKANTEYNKCKYDKCGTQVLTTESCEAADRCGPSYVKSQCAKYCLLPVDQRYDTASAFIYDCAALTRQAFTSSDCEVGVQFNSCNSIWNY